MTNLVRLMCKWMGLEILEKTSSLLEILWNKINLDCGYWRFQDSAWVSIAEQLDYFNKRNMLVSKSQKVSETKADKQVLPQYGQLTRFHIGQEKKQ